MTIEQIAQQYDKHMARLIKRAMKDERPSTDKERLGIAYYNRAGVQVHALYSSYQEFTRPKTGFIMRTAEELAPLSTAWHRRKRNGQE